MASRTVAALNEAIQVPKTVSVGTLKTDARYRVKELRPVTTKYGTSIAATLLSPVKKNATDPPEEIYVFLPQRVASFLNEDLVQELNEGPPLYLLYLGKIGNCFNVQFEH